MHGPSLVSVARRKLKQICSLFVCCVYFFSNQFFICKTVYTVCGCVIIEVHLLYSFSSLSSDIVDGNLKSIMRLILALAAHFKPNSVKQSNQKAPQADGHQQQSMAGIAHVSWGATLPHLCVHVFVSVTCLWYGSEDCESVWQTKGVSTQQEGAHKSRCHLLVLRSTR